MTRAARPSNSVANRISLRVMKTGAGLVGRRQAAIRVEGREHLPKSGPALLAARHYHHLLDGCALLSSIDRPVHILVALDWVKGGAGRRLMETACGMARWPVVLRGDGLAGQSAGTAFRSDESRRYLRTAVRESVELLRSGELLVVFPEAYPNIDPAYTPKSSPDAFLPFRPGYLRLVKLAQRNATCVPIVPVGFAYLEQPSGRWSVTMRIGEPLHLTADTNREHVARTVEERVRALSGLAPVADLSPVREAVLS